MNPEQALTTDDLGRIRQELDRSRFCNTCSAKLEEFGGIVEKLGVLKEQVLLLRDAVLQEIAQESNLDECSRLLRKDLVKGKPSILSLVFCPYRASELIRNEI
jgi:hypothetical protein